MPSTATITAFYTFTQNTKARASQVNNNFDVLRGHIIPIDPNTTTSNDITYDLGSDEHRWRNGYVKTLDFDRSTSTASATIEADANTNTGEMIFKINGIEKLRIVAGGYSGNNAKLMDQTIAASVSQFALSSLINLTIGAVGTAGSFNVTNSTITISSLGRPIKFQLIANNNSTLSGLDFQDVAASSARISLVRNGSTISVYDIDNPNGPQLPPNVIDFIDFPGTLTAAIYNLSILLNSVGDRVLFRNVKFCGYELSP